jgi:hypothetical protein
MQAQHEDFFRAMVGTIFGMSWLDAHLLACSGSLILALLFFSGVALTGETVAAQGTVAGVAILIKSPALKWDLRKVTATADQLALLWPEFRLRPSRGQGCRN